MTILAEFLYFSLVALLGFSGAMGLLALASPGAFAAVSSYGNRIVHQPTRSGAPERWFDIDRYVLPHARTFGLIIVASEGFIWFVYCYGPEAYSKSFSLIIVSAAILVGIMALGQIVKQKQDIESNLAEALTDVLTKLPNRRSFDEELSRRLAQRQRLGTPLCLLIIDIDNFKSLNDGFGHLAGDAILKKVAAVLRSTARHMDIVFRLGGDEFVVLLPGVTLEDASRASERFRAAIGANPLRVDNQQYALTISSGVAEAQVDDDARSLLKRADSALYAAKEAGRNCCFRHGGPELATVDPAVSETACTSESEVAADANLPAG